MRKILKMNKESLTMKLVFKELRGMLKTWYGKRNIISGIIPKFFLFPIAFFHHLFSVIF